MPLLLQLGCGAGIPGIVARKLGALAVHFQDYVCVVMIIELQPDLYATSWVNYLKLLCGPLFFCSSPQHKVQMVSNCDWYLYVVMFYCQDFHFNNTLVIGF